MTDTTTSAYYVGVRTTVKNKLAHFWLLDGETELRGYAKNIVSWAQVGERFALTLTADR